MFDSFTAYIAISFIVNKDSSSLIDVGGTKLLHSQIWHNERFPGIVIFLEVIPHGFDSHCTEFTSAVQIGIHFPDHNNTICGAIFLTVDNQVQKLTLLRLPAVDKQEHIDDIREILAIYGRILDVDGYDCSNFNTHPTFQRGFWLCYENGHAKPNWFHGTVRHIHPQMYHKSQSPGSMDVDFVSHNAFNPNPIFVAVSVDTNSTET
ncbi:hypothetical protein J3Q64DRAFT_1704735 [Phycomyces blakesleeanus]|uniref:Uncharacterized protein n=1 Tax=Phycomyces blakesleeanus TaxID=4837 RepID=A0ABR3AI05_PHYBL